MSAQLAADLADLGGELRGAAARHLAARARRRRRHRLVVLCAALACLTGATAVAGIQYSQPSPSTRPLNLQYTACIQAHGATWTPIPGSGGMFSVDVPADAVEHCEALDLAREAAGDGHAHAAAWLALIGSAPLSFWSCIGAQGYHVTGGAGQRDDYGSLAFLDVARSCAAQAGIELPTYDSAQ